MLSREFGYLLPASNGIMQLQQLSMMSHLIVQKNTMSLEFFERLKKVSNVNLSNAGLMEWTKNVTMLKSESQNLKEI